MKKYVLFMLAVLGWIGSVQSLEVEARVAYLVPQEQRVRKIYGSGFAEWELEAITPLGCHMDCFDGFDAFANLAYYQKSGRSTCSLSRNHTRIRNWAINVGALRQFDTCTCYHPYLGFGIGAVNVSFHNDSDYVSRHPNKWGFALLAKSGIKIDIMCDVFLDFFVDYAYHCYGKNKGGCNGHSNVNTGGVLIGGGIGYRF